MKKTFRIIINFFKKIIPTGPWLFVRKGYYLTYDFFRGLGPYVRQRKYCGFDLYYNKGNNIILRLKKETIFEEDMCRKIVSYLQEKREYKVIDIGANIGFISTYILSQVPQVKIYAFEPGPVQREMFEMTVAKNGISEKVTVYPHALSNKEGRTTFYSHDPKYVAGDGLIDTGRAHGARKVEVAMTTLDRWWNTAGRPKVDIVKIDTEGAEFWILEGAREFISQVKPVIFLEIEPLNLKAYPHTHLDILKWFEDNSYTLTTLDGSAITQSNFKDYIGKEDTYIALPKASL